MRSAFDFSPYRRSTVGFDRLFDMLENSSFGASQENYPPFDLIKAGDNQLVVSGRKNEESEERGPDYIYRGIANRSFERRFALADHIKVTGADLKDGLLVVDLVREIPESMKPKKIDIGSGAGRKERSAIGGGDQPASKQTVDAEAEKA
jgi:molecular chaperone IbpA